VTAETRDPLEPPAPLALRPYQSPDFECVSLASMVRGGGGSGMDELGPGPLPDEP